MAARAGITPIVFCNSAGALARAQTAGLEGILSRGKNVGYGNAANMAAEGREFSWLILCNDDLEIELADFDRFIEIVRSQSSSEPWAIGLISWTEPDRPSLPGLKSVFANLSLLAATKNRMTVIKRRPASTPRLAEVPKRTAFPFVCAALSAGSWKATGGFDARYPLYFEDMDYLRRACEIPEHRFGLVRARVRHAGSTSARATLDWSIPILAWSAFQYLMRSSHQLPILILSPLGLALVIRLAFIPFAASPVRAHARGVVRALVLLLTRQVPPMPPWQGQT
jgi:GT2 family glycosyltransferase